jgi:hypothetical protein
MSGSFENALKIANKKHDLVAIRIFDERETLLPDVGLIQLKDAETGELFWVDSSDKKVRSNYTKWWMKKDNELTSLFAKNGVDTVKIRTDESYVQPLMRMFKKREKRL